MTMAVSRAIKNISLHWRCFSAAAGVFPHHVPKLLLLPTTFQTSILLCDMGVRIVLAIL
jgi:hypothetical protein